MSNRVTQLVSVAMLTIGLIVVAVIISRSLRSGATSETVQKESSRSDTPVRVTVNDLAIALRQGQGVDPRYTGKIIELVGEVVSVEDGRLYLLSVSDPVYNTRSVYCQFSEKTKGSVQLKELMQGQTVQVTGICGDVQFITIDQANQSRREYANAKQKQEELERRIRKEQPWAPFPLYNGPTTIEQAFWSVTITDCTKLIIKPMSEADRAKVENAKAKLNKSTPVLSTPPILNTLPPPLNLGNPIPSMPPTLDTLPPPLNLGNPMPSIPPTLDTLPSRLIG